MSTHDEASKDCDISETVSCSESGESTDSSVSELEECSGEVSQDQKTENIFPGSKKVGKVPVKSVGFCDRDHEDFMYKATCGIIKPISNGSKGLERPTEGFEFLKMKSRMVVHRREMSPENASYRTIRTRTASVLALGYFGTYEQVCSLALHNLRVFLTRSEIDDACKLTTPSKLEVLVLLSMTGVLEPATFSFSNTMKSKDPLIYKIESVEKPLYGIVYEFFIVACNTTVRNVPGSVIKFVAHSVDPAGDFTQKISSTTSVTLDVQKGALKREGYLNKRKKLQSGSWKRPNEVDLPQDYNLTRKIRNLFN